MSTVHTHQNTSTARASANFLVREFACHGTGCCRTLQLDDALVTLLQQLRTHFGSPVTVTSGYRCQTHNKAVGGARNSYHTKGQAADITVKQVPPAKVAAYAEEIGVRGIGLYEGADGNFVHLDTRKTKAFWRGHAQTPCATFGGTSPVKAWQTAALADGCNLPSGADGVWGPACEEAAKKAVCKRRPVYRYRHLTQLVQQTVGVTADGKFGKATEAAVKRYQTAHGLTADGIVGHDTWKSLLGV